MKARTILLMLAVLLIAGCQADEELDAAVDSGDPEECKKLESGTSEDALKRVGRCLSLIAYDKGDESLCVDIKDDYYKDNCYLDIAVKKGESSLCESVEGDSFQDDCFARVGMNTHDPNACIRAGARKDECLTMVAETLVNENVCSKVDNSGPRTTCYAKVAIAAKKPEICDDVHVGSKDACYKEYSMGSGDALGCQKVSEGRRDACYLDTAVAQDEIRVCEEIDKEGPLYADCVIGVTKNTGHLDNCRLLGDSPDDQQKCYEYVGSYYSNSEACSKVENAGRRDACLMEAVMRTGEDEICKGMVSASRVNECWTHVAAVRDQKNYCQKIEDYDDRQVCFKQFE